MIDLTGRVAVVFGAGIGQATALTMAGLGSHGSDRRSRASCARWAQSASERMEQGHGMCGEP